MNRKSTETTKVTVTFETDWLTANNLIDLHVLMDGNDVGDIMDYKVAADLVRFLIGSYENQEPLEGQAYPNHAQWMKGADQIISSAMKLQNLNRPEDIEDHAD